MSKQSPLPQLLPLPSRREVLLHPTLCSPSKRALCCGGAERRKGSGCMKFFLNPGRDGIVPSGWQLFTVGFCPGGVLKAPLWATPLDCNSWEVGVASLLAGSGFLLTGPRRLPLLGTSSQVTETLWQDRLLPHHGPVPTAVLQPLWRSRAFPLGSRNFREPVTSSPGGILEALLPRFGIRRQPPTPTVPPDECQNSA